MSFEMLPLPDEREDWLQMRRQGIGGSDVAGILGLSPWTSAYEVWASKVLDYRIDETEAMEWGTRLEYAVAARFTDDHPEMVVAQPKEMYRSIEYPFMLANPDRILAAGSKDATALLEVKTGNWRMSEHWENGPPVYYRTQVNHYLDVLGLKTAWVAVLLGGNDYREYRIEFDEAAAESMRVHLAVFWDLVEARTPPEVVANDSQILATIFPQHDDSTVIASSELLAAHSRLTDIKADAKEIADSYALEIEFLTAEVKAAMGTAHLMTDEAGTPLWTWTTAKPKTTISAASLKEMQAEHPDLYDGYTTTKPGTRTLRTKAIKE